MNQNHLKLRSDLVFLIIALRVSRMMFANARSPRQMLAGAFRGIIELVSMAY
jgi:hypothetical protein